MKKLIAIYGLIAGAIPGISFFLYFPTESDQIMHMEYGQLIGFSVMIVAFTSILFGVKQYRDAQPDKKVSFGKAFLMGVLMSLIASIIYAASWEIFTSINDINFAEQYEAYQQQQIEESGDTPEVMQQTSEENAQFIEWYKNNTLFRFSITMTEIFPVGLLMSLLAAVVFGLILKPKT